MKIQKAERRIQNNGGLSKLRGLSPAEKGKQLLTFVPSDGDLSMENILDGDVEYYIYDEQYYHYYVYSLNNNK